jgi:2-dehydropantoate 2-reductase
MFEGKRIAVFGTGAQGASVGADLLNAGLDVTFIDQWTPHVAAMNRDGIRVNFPDESVVTPVRALQLYEVPQLRRPFDFVFIAFKAYDARWATEMIAPFLAPDGLVIGMQNGMTMDAMASIVGPERTVGVVVEIAANMWDPGVVNRETPHDDTWFAVGSAEEGAHEAEAQVVELLSNVGSTQISEDIRSSKWMKLVVNASEMLSSSILGMTVVGSAELPGVRDLMGEAAKEAMSAGIAAGRKVMPIIEVPLGSDEGPTEYALRLRDRILAHYNSPTTQVAVLQDWLKGRRAETDDVSGLVVSEHERLGGDAPVNRHMVEIAHEIERGDLTPSEDNLERLLAMPASA